MPKKKDLEFWLRVRGRFIPFITYRGGGMKAIVNLEIPLDEIAEFYGLTELTIGKHVYKKTGSAVEKEA